MGVEQPVNLDVEGKRKAKRARVLLSVKLETALGQVDGRLRDLSRKGALVECSPTPSTGSEVLFVRGSTSVPARVAWSQRGRIGLEFQYMIEESDVLVQLKPNNASSAPRFRRPGIKEGLSESERKLAAAWGVQVGIALPDGYF